MKYIYISLSAFYVLMGILWGYWTIITNNIETFKIDLDLYYIGLIIVGLILFFMSMREPVEQRVKLQVLKLAVIINTLVIAVWSICCLKSILLLGCFGVVFFFVLYFLLDIGKSLPLLNKWLK